MSNHEWSGNVSYLKLELFDFSLEGRNVCHDDFGYSEKKWVRN
jgi:hypothetical protein